MKKGNTLEKDVSTTTVEGKNADSTAAVSNTRSEVSAAASQEVKRKPMMTFHEGDLSAAVWGREVQVDGKPVTMCSVTIERQYRDRGGARRFTNSLNMSDMAQLVSLARAVEEYGKGLRQSESNQNA